jgi:hypothetical protein
MKNSADMNASAVPTHVNFVETRKQTSLFAIATRLGRMEQKLDDVLAEVKDIKSGVADIAAMVRQVSR